LNIDNVLKRTKHKIRDIYADFERLIKIVITRKLKPKQKITSTN